MHDSIEIEPTNKFKITNTRRVLMFVNYASLKQIGNEILVQLPNKRNVNSYLNNEHFHITLGIVTNSALLVKHLLGICLF